MAMKKVYISPETKVEAITMAMIICGSITDTSSDDGIGYGGGSGGPAHAPKGDWDWTEGGDYWED